MRPDPALAARGRCPRDRRRARRTRDWRAPRPAVRRSGPALLDAGRHLPSDAARSTPSRSARSARLAPAATSPAAPPPSSARTAADMICDAATHVCVWTVSRRKTGWRALRAGCGPTRRSRTATRRRPCSTACRCRARAPGVIASARHAARSVLDCRPDGGSFRALLGWRPDPLLRSALECDPTRLVLSRRPAGASRSAAARRSPAPALHAAARGRRRRHGREPLHRAAISFMAGSAGSTGIPISRPRRGRTSRSC